MTVLGDRTEANGTARVETAGIASELVALVAPLFRAGLPFRIRAWDGSEAGAPAGPPEPVVVVLRSPDALRRLLWSPGELGLAQAYVTGELDVEGDLKQALSTIWQQVRDGRVTTRRLPPRQLAAAVGLARRLGVVGRPLPAPASQARLSGRLHTRRRDRSAISHHYDLSNDFYALVLDPRMAYSSAYWTRDDADYDLTAAQRDKFDLVCRKLDLQPGQRLLDVGCGWGSTSLHAAAHYGVRVTGVTLSREQQAFATARARAEGLDETVTFRLQDYRDVNDGPYDAVVSLEMGEHVGAGNYPTYAAQLFRQLRPEGRLLLQQMSRHDSHPGGGAFIESYIAPDMHMRPVGQTVDLLESAGFEVRDVHALREHYVRTVDAWYATFEQRFAEAVAMVGEEVARVWRLYLVGGALAFEEGRMGVDQILAVKPGPGGRSGMPATRAGYAD